LTVDGAEIATIETTGMAAQDEELVGPQSPAAAPIGERPTTGIGAQCPHSAVTPNPHTRTKPADDIAGASRDDLEQQAVHWEIATPRGILPKVDW
jgi:hypothetical protein